MYSWARKVHGSIITGCLVVMAISRPAAAAEGNPPPNLGLSLGLGWSDNIEYRAADKKAGDFESIGLNLAYHRESVRLQGDVDVGLSYQRYSGSATDSRLIGGAAAAMVLGIVPDVLKWNFLDNFTQMRTDALAGDVPANLTSANFLSTGPTVLLPLGSSTRLNIEGLYSLEQFGTQDKINKRADGSVALEREIGASSVLSANVSAGRHWLGDATLDDFTVRAASLGLLVRRGRTEMTSEVGFQEVQTSTEIDNGLLVQLHLQQQLSASSVLRLDLLRQYTDTSDVLRAGQDVGDVGQPADFGIPTAAAFLQRTAALGWEFSRNRTSVTVSSAYADQRFIGVAGLDRKLVQYEFAVDRKVRPTANARVGFRGVFEDFEAGARAEEAGAFLTLQIHHAPNFSWNLMYEFRNRGGEGPVARFTENRLLLSGEWTPLANR